MPQGRGSQTWWSSAYPRRFNIQIPDPHPGDSHLVGLGGVASDDSVDHQGSGIPDVAPLSSGRICALTLVSCVACSTPSVASFLYSRPSGGPAQQLEGAFKNVSAILPLPCTPKLPMSMAYHV